MRQTYNQRKSLLAVFFFLLISACGGGGGTNPFSQQGSFLLTVIRTGPGSGTVTSSPSGINCGATCSASFSSGTSVTLTATSTLGFLFTGWTGEDCSGTGTCSVTMSAARSVTAVFNPPAPFNKAPGFDSAVNTIAPAGDGSGDIYVGGAFTTYNGTSSPRIVRLNANGTIDTAFVVGTGFAGNVTVNAIAPAGDGDIYVGGDFTSYSGTVSNGIIRLNSDGAIDTAFSVGTGFNDNVFAIAPAGDGDIYVGGLFTAYNTTTSNSIIRLNSNGTIDTAFSVGTGFSAGVFAIAPDKNGTGDLYVGGSFTAYNSTSSNSIIRLNFNGTVDTAFSVGAGFNNSVDTIALTEDGTGVYVGGAFTTYNTTPSNGIIRINSNGSVDTAFVVGTGFTGNVTAIAPSGDGDIYVGGNFTTYKGTVSNGIIRINSNGSVDAAFVVGTGFIGNTNTIAPAGDGSGDIYTGGDFTSYGTTTVDKIARLAANGTVR